MKSCGRIWRNWKRSIRRFLFTILHNFRMEVQRLGWLFWGGLRACFVVLVGLIVSFSPTATRTGESAALDGMANLDPNVGIGIFQGYYQANQLSNYTPSQISWISSLETFSIPLYSTIISMSQTQQMLTFRRHVLLRSYCRQILRCIRLPIHPARRNVPPRFWAHDDFDFIKVLAIHCLSGGCISGWCLFHLLSCAWGCVDVVLQEKSICVGDYGVWVEFGRCDYANHD